MKDIKINRAQQHFIDALLHLMKEKPFHKITIHELSQVAEYDRRTYYRYFETKEDVLLLYCSVILQDMSQTMKSHLPLKPREGMMDYFLFWKQYQPFLTLLSQNGLLPFLEQKHSKMLYEIVGKSVQPDIPNDIDAASVLSRYSYYFMVGGLWQILIGWIASGMEESPHVLTECILTLFEELPQFEI